jgi:O-6-methylguanine DNA methyltransferase
MSAVRSQVPVRSLAQAVTPLGTFTALGTEEGICQVLLPGQTAYWDAGLRPCAREEQAAYALVSGSQSAATPASPCLSLEEAGLPGLPWPFVDMVDGYFQGTRRDFPLPLDLMGTPFQLRVWYACAAIPYGRTATYGQLAQDLGAPGAARAVGGALHVNPVPLLIPCHRVLAASGPGGFGGGLPLKQALLRHEGALDTP